MFQSDMLIQMRPLCETFMTLLFTLLVCHTLMNTFDVLMKSTFGIESLWTMLKYILMSSLHAQFEHGCIYTFLPKDPSHSTSYVSCTSSFSVLEILEIHFWQFFLDFSIKYQILSSISLKSWQMHHNLYLFQHQIQVGDLR